MRSTIHRALAVILLPLVVVNSAGAAEDSLECGIMTTSVYFGNGINTSRAKAELSKFALKGSYDNVLQSTYPGQNFDFKVAYNQTYGLSADLSEVFLQTASEEERAVYEQLSSEQLFLLMSASQERFNEVAESISQQFSDVITGNQFLEFFSLENFEALREEMDDALDSAMDSAEFAARVLEADTSETLTQLYRNDLDVGQRVIVVAHSQGNLFARDNIESVISSNPEYQTSIGSVGVATPSNRQPNGGAYITAHDDRVIDALRVAAAVDGIASNEPLDSNWDNDPGFFSDPRDFLNHGFLESYFRGELTSMAQIDNLLYSLAASLEFPESVIGSGALRVTLEWGAEPDVDLHAYEPDGSHVYYANLQGSSGALDRDDVDSFGPENYFVPCESLVVGSYGFGVNYYSGQAPEVASISLILSDGQTASLNVPLSVAIGSDGNLPPIVLGVTVTQDDTGAFQYELLEGISAAQQIVMLSGDNATNVEK